jgi:ribosome-binding protein aMBF1 (putative translation factor)
MLTREREARHWSRAELARRARMNPADVGKIEAGRATPYPGQLRKLAQALEWAPSEEHGLMETVAEITRGVEA